MNLLLTTCPFSFQGALPAPPAGAHLLLHGLLRRDREGREDHGGGAARGHRRHPRALHRILHLQRRRDSLLPRQVRTRTQGWGTSVWKIVREYHCQIW